VSLVPPRFPWEIEQLASVLIASALAAGRPAALTGEPLRLNGLPDSEVIERYLALRAAVERAMGQDTRARTRLAELEREHPARGWTPWQTVLTASGATSDPAVIDLAHRVWEALGPNAYAVHLRDRPRTYRGFAESRTWLVLGLLGEIGILSVVSIAHDAWGPAWWLVLPAAVLWPVLLRRSFVRRYRRLRRIGGAELPHL
jgi:hypothetical protein